MEGGGYGVLSVSVYSPETMKCYVTRVSFRGANTVCDFCYLWTEPGQRFILCPSFSSGMLSQSPFRQVSPHSGRHGNNLLFYFGLTRAGLIDK